MTDEIRNQHVCKQKNVVHSLCGTRDAAWTNFTHLEGTESFAMTCTEPVEVHGEEGEEDL